MSDVFDPDELDGFGAVDPECPDCGFYLDVDEDTGMSACPNCGWYG